MSVYKVTKDFKLIIVLTVFCVFTSIADCKQVSGQAVNDTLTIAFIFAWSGSWPAALTMGGAFLVGLEEVQRRNLLPGYNIEWEFGDDGCDAMKGMKTTIEIWKKVEDLDVLMGPSCSVCCEPVALLAAGWNLPVVSSSCLLDKLSQKSKYPTFIRTAGNSRTILSPAFAIVSDVFGWETIGIITSTEYVSGYQAVTMKSIMETKGTKVYFVTVDPTIIGDQIIEGRLEKQ